MLMMVEVTHSVRDIYIIAHYCLCNTGNVTISGDIKLTVVSDLNGVSPQFTLTSISIGGPATTVTWTRDSVPAIGEAETVLNDPETAQYTHTLTVTERLGGLYTCTVANNRPSSDRAQLNGIVLLTMPPYTMILCYCILDLKMFVAAPGQRTVKFSWSTLLAGHSYNLSCGAPPLSSLIFVSISPSQSTSLTVEGFSPNTSYLCVVETNQSFIPAFIDFTTLDCELKSVILEPGIIMLYMLLCRFLLSVYPIT